MSQRSSQKQSPEFSRVEVLLLLKKKKNQITLSHIKFRTTLHIGRGKRTICWEQGANAVVSNQLHSNQLEGKMQSQKNILNRYGCEAKIGGRTVELDVLFQALLYVYPYLVVLCQAV